MAFENLKKTGIKYLLGRIKAHLESGYLQIKDAILSVNGVQRDEYGNVQINRVNYAGDLESSFSQTSDETFLQRTSGGNASINNGDAWLSGVIGNSIHEGFVDEVLEMDVRPISEETPITATIDRDIFVAYVAASGTITLTFTTVWSEDPANYGITVTGTPSAGDQIVIEYVKEDPGVITTATPSSFVSTGWNLYQSSNGYAKVVHYSDDYGYMITGDYTGLQFSTTISGERTTIEDEDGLFNVDSDGYVWVTGGNAANTAIWPTQSDWTDGYPVEFEGYNSTEIDLSTVMQDYFPYGLCKVGNVADEINLSLGVAYVRIDQMENTAANMATAKASGRLFEYDETTIYIVKAVASSYSIDVSGAYIANDHGIEYFLGSSIPAEAQTIYGMNLKNKLERDVLTKSQQTLSAAEQKQARQNIGAGQASNDTDLEAFKMNAMKKGANYMRGALSCPGFLSGGGKDLYLTYPVTTYGCTDISGVTITNITVRGINGYILHDDTPSSGGFSIAAWRFISGSGFRIQISKNNGNWSTTNNTPVVANIDGTVTFK